MFNSKFYLSLIKKLTCFIFTPVIFTPYSVDANELPTISLTMFLVAAQEACSPDGYTRRCPQLLDSDILNFKKNRRTSRTNALTSEDESFPLGNKLLRPIHAYAKANESLPRAAIVMVFDFGNTFRNSKVPIRVMVLDRNKKLVRNYIVSDLKNPSTFIYHHRADDFQPTKDFQWILTAGKFSWKIKTID